MHSHTKQNTPRGSAGVGWHVAWLTLCGALGGFLFGYDTGVISGALPFMEDDILSAYKDDAERLHIWKEWIVSSALMGAMFGSIAGGYFSDRIGRKKVLMIGDVFFCLGSVTMAASQNLFSMILGRLLVGLGVGLASVVVPVYIAECSPAQQRAMLVSANVLMITSGQFCSYVMNYVFTHVSGTWRWMVGIAVLPALMQAASLPFLPESPKWLHSKGYRAQASKISAELGIEEIGDGGRAGKGFTLSMLLEPEIQYELRIGVSLQILQQFCGINTVMYYTPTILQMAGYVDRQEALLVSLLPAFVNSIGTVIGMWCVEKCGRRKLLLSSMVAVSISLFLLGKAFSLQNSQGSVVPAPLEQNSGTCTVARNCQECVQLGCGFCPVEGGKIGFCLDQDRLKDNPDACQTLGTVLEQSACSTSDRGYIVVYLLIYLISFSPGLGPVPWAVNAEIYPLEMRGVGNGVATTVNWLSNFIISQVFLSLVDWIGAAGFFWMCSLIAAAGVAGMFWYLPETRSLTLEEVQKAFKRRAGGQSSISRDSVQ